VRLRLIVLLIATVAACSRTEPAVAPPTTTSVTECPDRADRTDVAYTERRAPGQRLDLYQPDVVGCDAVPLVVWVHGGGWVLGDKANDMDDKVSLWNDAGWAVASVNYGLTYGGAPVDERIVAPRHNEDVAAALGWLVTTAPQLGVDPERIAVVGHSAGAGIAAALAADPAYLADEDLRPADLTCVALLDTEGFDIGRLTAGDGWGAQLYRIVFGNDPQRWQELSPITHVGEAELPDVFLVTRGSVERRAVVADFADAARSAGGRVTVVDVPSFSHADVNQRIGDPTDEVLTPALQRWLEGCLD